MKSRNGACFCGNIQLLLKEEPKLIVNCHCNNCRSHTGSAFSSYIALASSALEVNDEKGYLTGYKSEIGTKFFCKNCGTPVYNITQSNPDGCMVYLGVLDDISDLTPRRNIWCDSQLPWVRQLSSIKSLGQGIGRK